MPVRAGILLLVALGHGASLQQESIDAMRVTVWKLEARVLIGGTTMAAPMSPDSDALTRIARPIASRLLSMTIGLSLKRKFFTGLLILPFSIRKVPSRVRPV